MRKTVLYFLKSLFIIIPFVIILSVIIPSALSSFANADYSDEVFVETDDVANFFNKTYLEYNGGKNAEVFFNEYAYLDEYKDIAFYYKDHERKQSLFEEYSHTAFALDVYYDEETFMKVSNSILLDITGTKAEELFALHGTQNRTHFSGYEIKRNDSVYSENSAVIDFDPRYNTIRYVFLCNNTGGYSKVGEAIVTTLDLPCNITEKDWAFDYSDIVTAEQDAK